MKLKEFSIIRYGPLPSTERISLHNFNLFWGKNEDGKTLTIDALVKLLLGRNIKDFDRSIDRVEEKPEGYVIVEDDTGKEIKLPDRGDLTKVTDLTSSECCNIFVIRNSDLSIACEDELYTNVADRLTGLKTEEISRIEEALREISKITPSGVFRDIKGERLKTRVEKAQELVVEIETLAKNIEDERFDEFEEESIRLEEDIEKISQEIRDLEDARKREQYERGKEALDKLAGALEKTRGLENYNKNGEQSWRDSEEKIKEHARQKNDGLKKLQEFKEELEQTNVTLRKIEGEVAICRTAKNILNDEVKPELEYYKMEFGKVKSEETKNKFYVVAAITSAILLSISILAVMRQPAPVFYGLLAFFLISAIIFAGLRFLVMRKKAHLSAVFERIRLTASRFEFNAESPEKLYSSIQKFEQEYEYKSEGLQSVRSSKEKLEEKIEELRDSEIPKIQDKINEAEQKIHGVRIKSKEESLEKYTEKLAWKDKFESSIREQESVLKSHFEEKGNRLEEKISYWNEEIENLGEYKDKAKNTKYNVIVASTLDEERRKRQSDLEKVREKIGPLQKEMEAVERETNEILRLDEPLYCHTLVDLKAIKDKLQCFAEENENNKEYASKAIEIFKEMEKEEREKVSKLFGSESPVSKYFNQITNGLYEEVLFDREMLKIQIKRRDGRILGAEKLSGGAYDQLYLSVRLALGEKLLKGRKGFFIMDDPFVKADPDRLRRQIETLNKISELGWQVIYFSAKGEIKDALEEDIKRDAINYVEVQGIFS